MAEYSRRKEDADGYKIRLLGKYATAIIAIGVLLMGIGSLIWAKKDDVQKLDKKVETNIVSIKKDIEFIKTNIGEIKEAVKK